MGGAPRADVPAGVEANLPGVALALLLLGEVVPGHPRRPGTARSRRPRRSGAAPPPGCPICAGRCGGVVQRAGEHLLEGGAVGDLPETLHVGEVDLELPGGLAWLDRVAEDRVKAVQARRRIEQNVVLVPGKVLKGAKPWTTG